MSQWSVGLVISTQCLLTLFGSTDNRQKAYAPGSAERAALEHAITEMEQQLPFEVPCVVNGKPVRAVYLKRHTTILIYSGQNRKTCETTNSS